MGENRERGALTRQQGPPSALEMGSERPTVARALMKRAGVGEAGGSGRG